MSQQHQIKVHRRTVAGGGESLRKRRAWFNPIDSQGFKALTDLDPVLTEIFFQEYRQVSPVLLNQIIGVRNSTKARERSERMGSFGDPQPWDGQVHYTDAAPDFSIEWPHGELTLGFKVTKTMLEDNQFDIFDKAADLAQSFSRKVVKDEASTFENAFSGVLGYDSVPLVSANHPRSLSDSTTVSNNLGTVALTEAQIEAAAVRMGELGDDRGEPIVTIPDVLLVGPAQRMTARKLTESTHEPETANNAINTASGLRTIVHPLITGKKWFLIDSAAARRAMLWFWRVPLEFGVSDDEAKTLVRSFYGRYRYSFGWRDWRWVVGSNPS